MAVHRAETIAVFALFAGIIGGIGYVISHAEPSARLTSTENPTVKPDAAANPFPSSSQLSAVPAPFVATPSNKYAWNPDVLPVDWPKFTKLPNEKPLPVKTTAAKIELASSLIGQWNSYKAGSAKTAAPTSKDADVAIKYLLSIERNDPAFPQAWATFIKLKQVDEAISDEKAALVAREEERKRARQRGVNVGMTAQQVLDSSWGKPQKVNVTITGGGRHEQWVYAGYQYLYIENGILTSIQTSR